MSDPIKTEVVLKEPISVIVETKEKEHKKFIGLSDAELDFFKWIIGTLILGGVGLWISWRHNTSDENLAKYDADVKLITSVNFDTTSDGQYKNLLNIQPFIITESVKKIVNDRIDSIYKRSQTPVVLNTSFNKDSVKATNDLQKEKKILIQLIPSAPTKNNDQKPLTTLKDSENTIIGTKSTLLFDSAALQKLFETNAVTINSTKNDYKLIGLAQTKWCKQGYYIEFNNTLRIGINYLNNSNQTVTVNFKDIENGAGNQIPVLGSDDNTKTLNVGENYILYNETKTYQYQITLNYIGAAGRNPFTKAAYITVAAYKKQ